MIRQSVLFGMVIATLYGAAFHLWRGGSVLRFVLYLVFAWTGFWGGHWLGNLIGWDLIKVGQLNLGTATIGSIIVLGIGYWLSLVQVEQERKAGKKL